MRVCHISVCVWIRVGLWRWLCPWKEVLYEYGLCMGWLAIAWHVDELVWYQLSFAHTHVVDCLKYNMCQLLGACHHEELDHLVGLCVNIRGTLCGWMDHRRRTAQPAVFQRRRSMSVPPHHFWHDCNANMYDSSKQSRPFWPTYSEEAVCRFWLSWSLRQRPRFQVRLKCQNTGPKDYADAPSILPIQRLKS